jgi:glutamine cyclotransferase
MFGKRCNCSSKPCKWAVEGIIDLSGLRKMVKNTTVLNGIAYNPKNWNYFCNRKNWDKIFEITVSE